jgi:hypothetical protein
MSIPMPMYIYTFFRRSKGEAIPTSQAEMAEMQERDHRLRPLAQKMWVLRNQSIYIYIYINIYISIYVCY